MQVPEPWQRNWVSASHTVVAKAAGREKEVKVGVRKGFLLPKCAYSVQGSEGKGTAPYELWSVQA